MLASSTRPTPTARLTQALISRWLRPSRRCSSATSRLRWWRSSRGARTPRSGPARARCRRSLAGAGAGRRLGCPEQRHLRRELGAQRHELGARRRLARAPLRRLVPVRRRAHRGAARGAARSRPPRRGRAASGSAGRYTQLGSAARPGIVRTKRPTIWRKISGVLAALAYTPTRSRGMSTPSETMFTATIHGSREPRKSASLRAAFGLRVQHHHRRAPGHLAQQLGHPAGVGGVGRDHEAARVAVARRAQRAQLGVGLAQDARQAVGQLGRDRRAVAAAGLARG